MALNSQALILQWKPLFPPHIDGQVSGGDHRTLFFVKRFLLSVESEELTSRNGADLSSRGLPPYSWAKQFVSMVTSIAIKSLYPPSLW